jgi:ribonuclease E
VPESEAAALNGPEPVPAAAEPAPEPEAPAAENLAVESSQVVNQPPEAPKRGWWRRGA